MTSRSTGLDFATLVKLAKEHEEKERDQHKSPGGKLSGQSKNNNTPSSPQPNQLASEKKARPRSKKESAAEGIIDSSDDDDDQRGSGGGYFNGFVLGGGLLSGGGSGKGTPTSTLTPSGKTTKRKETSSVQSPNLSPSLPNSTKQRSFLSPNAALSDRGIENSESSGPSFKSSKSPGSLVKSPGSLVKSPPTSPRPSNTPLRRFTTVGTSTSSEGGGDFFKNGHQYTSEGTSSAAAGKINTESKTNEPSVPSHLAVKRLAQTRHRSSRASFDWYSDAPYAAKDSRRSQTYGSAVAAVNGKDKTGQETDEGDPTGLERSPSRSGDNKTTKMGPDDKKRLQGILSHAHDDSDRELRGAFAAEDFDRGSRLVRGLTDAPGKQSTLGPLSERGRHSTSTSSSGPFGRGDRLRSQSQNAVTLKSAVKALQTPNSKAASVKEEGESSIHGDRPYDPIIDDKKAFRDSPEQTHHFDSLSPSGKQASASSSASPFSMGKKGSLWSGAVNFLPGSSALGRMAGERSESPDRASSIGIQTQQQGGQDGSDHERPSSPRPSYGARRTSGWGALRSKLINKGAGTPTSAKLLGKSLKGTELITELATGALPLAMIKMAILDRDERGDHRIPVLMNYLKLRITDSIYPLHERHAVFRTELEYGDGLKWVIYRELKDFLNLHAHYRVANLRQGIDKFPAFPKTSLPYLNWLKSEGKGPVKKSDFAKAQREALENYLLRLIRATMFGPGANRLCKFLEISAMSVALATRGGTQGKQGYLRIMSSGASRKEKGGFHPLSWKSRHGPKWFIVRDSYLVAVDDPASNTIYDVFMVDSSFEIERPSRIYRKGVGLFRKADSDEEEDDKLEDDGFGGPKESPRGMKGAHDPLDPSTTGHNDEPQDLRDTSNHTFFLISSERKVRFVAETERQQDQFIASIEKLVSSSIWAGKNRFDSFAPIRLNVAAQWLVDGRDYFWSLSRAILLAKEKIYIHDWWLSPELYLRRPPSKENEKWRLDNLLQRKAKEGVQIFVIVYKEVSNDFTPVESSYTKSRLRALHPNIHIQRSPSHTSTGTLFWSHHEKMCVIDETIGFMGGLDLCFGRWDTPGHVLVDDGHNVVDNTDGQNNQDGGEQKRTQIWKGKDYSNSRVLDFHTLSKPDEDMYDRSKVPRQPWHDIGLQIIGQPARDLCRHFIQRWNYLLRTKAHSIEMPFLLPAPDFTARELQAKRITGTCEVQICRSVGPWSMGITHTEHSIQNAYIKAIQLSDHFVYIENQFFISSTDVEGTTIENKIGDALVSRIIRAHTEGTHWRAIIIMPLIPGYPFPIDHGDAGSVRLIMECQYRTISRGEHSIFARLRREGIDPDEYISFFGLRGWGKVSCGTLATEDIYIHAKAMIVDDRTVIIGSANINERSQRGDRDSELACMIRDTDMIDSTMGGKRYKVGRFAHSMRVRLMREHLGIDVDELESEEVADHELMARQPEQMQGKGDAWDPDHEQQEGGSDGPKAGGSFNLVSGVAASVSQTAGELARGASQAVGLGVEKESLPLAKTLEHVPGGDARNADDKIQAEEDKEDGAIEESDVINSHASVAVPTLEEKVMAEDRPGKESRVGESGGGANSTKEEKESEKKLGHQTTQTSEFNDTSKLPSDTDRSSPSSDSTTEESILSNSAHLRPSTVPSSKESYSSPPSTATTPQKGSNIRSSKNGIAGSLRRDLRDRNNLYSVPVPPADIDPNGFGDPLVDSFYKDVWMSTAVRNTQAYRKVFRCVPDDLVQTWKQYREFQTWAERHNKPPKDVVPPGDEKPFSNPGQHQGQHGAGGGGSGGGVMGQGSDKPGMETMYATNSRLSSSAAGESRDTRAKESSITGSHAHSSRHGVGLGSSSGGGGGGGAGGGAGTQSSQKAQTAGGSGPGMGAVPNKSNKESSGNMSGEGHDHEEGFPAWEREQMEELLNQISGNLVVYPTRFLEAESSGGNFLFSKDRLPPLSIYN